VREALRAGNERPGFRVVAFSAMRNHLHYTVEVRCVARPSSRVECKVLRSGLRRP
jgi:REP element-mobilizing transposase RayT